MRKMLYCINIDFIMTELYQKVLVPLYTGTLTHGWPLASFFQGMTRSAFIASTSAAGVSWGTGCLLPSATRLFHPGFAESRELVES